MAAVSSPGDGHGQCPRIGHFVEAPGPRGARRGLHRRVGGSDPADEVNHIDKHLFKVPFRVRLPEPGRGAPRADINEGGGNDPHKGEAGTGDIVEAVRHIRTLLAGDPSSGSRCGKTNSSLAAKEMATLRTTWSSRLRRRASYRWSTSSPGGIAIPADAALAMQLGAEGVFVGSGIFRARNPARNGRAIVQRHAPLADNTQIIRRGLEGSGPPPDAGIARGHDPRD